MKNLRFAALTLLSCSIVCVAFGQTSFGLRNRYAGVDAPVFDAHGVPLEGPNYLVELWGGPTADSLSPALAAFSRQRIIVPFLSGAEAGYFRDGYGGRDGADHPSIISVPVYGWAWLEVRAWDARLGATYEEVVALGLGGYGASPTFYAQGGNPFDLLSLPPPLTGLQSFSLLEVIPEPSTAAFLALGALLLLLNRWFRSRSPATNRVSTPS